MTITKVDLRRSVRKILEVLTETQRKEKSHKLSSNLSKLISEHSPKIIGVFSPLKGEPEWATFIQGDLAFPGTRENGDMGFYACAESELVLTEDFGVPLKTPPKESKEVVPDVLVIPGLAFSRKGERLGRGKGFYDKYLKTYNGLKVGICFTDQLFAEIPTEPWDELIDVIVTDEEVLKVR